MNMKLRIGIITVATMLIAVRGQADSVTHGGTTINMDFVNIGYAGNVADTADGDKNAVGVQRYGSVDYNYRIGRFEVTADQWASVVSADSRVGSSGSWWGGSQPTATLTWYESAKFANWLTTGNAYSGAYQFNDSGTLTNVMTRAQIKADGGLFYVLPTEAEWYKAAYFKSDGSGYTLYATGDSIPTAGVGGENYNWAIGNPWNVGSGIAENNGTCDMNGNVFEWNESAYDGTLNSMDEIRVIRGGAFDRTEDNLRSSLRTGNVPAGGGYVVGLRIATIPEPSSIAMLGMIGGIGLFVRRTFRV